MKSLFYKLGRLLYRQFGWSAQQRVSRQYNGVIKDAVSSNAMIYDIIKKGNPAMISRLGTVETAVLFNYLEIKESTSLSRVKKLHAVFKGSANKWDSDVKKSIKDNAGFFPVNEEMLDRFTVFFLEQIKKIDAIAIWGFVVGETWLVHRLCQAAFKYDPKGLEPYYFSDPWSRALAGKTVLVIHPFIHSIRKQYKCREKLFDNPLILPDFDLVTIAAVQSIAGNSTEFKNWFEALDYMQREIDNVNFDVAIIGAGSYGLPLAAYIKEKGKIAIHIGGATQILFGIKGKRWDDHPVISKFYNEHWVRPELSETVLNAEMVEGGCYW